MTVADYAAEHGDPGFVTFMQRVDRIVRRAVGDQFGVLDFADAAWADLYEDHGEDCSKLSILDELASADGIFAAMTEELRR
jgi:hypothetical protein